MFNRKFLFAVFFVLFATLALEKRNSVEARYLRIRSDSDRIDKLKELLKDLLENEIEKEEYQADAPPRWHPENKLFYKREASDH